MGVDFSHLEETIRNTLLKEIKDVFVWSYEDMKHIQTEVVMHTIPMQHKTLLVFAMLQGVS